MRGVDDHADTARLEHHVDAVGDLRGQFLLHLEAPRIRIDDTRELADADDLVGRQVADMGAADDRRHVVFAERFEFDVAQHDHLVVAGHLLERAAQVVGRVDRVAGKPVAVRVDDALGRVAQALARRIFAGPAQQRAHRVFGLALADGCRGFRACHR